MPKFLANCHYNDEEISRRLKKIIRYWPVPINGNNFAIGQILKKNPEEVVKGRKLKSLSNPDLCFSAVIGEIFGHIHQLRS